MRITNRMLSKQVLKNINTVYKDLNTYHSQVATGKAFLKPSDDPVNAVRSMDVANKLKTTEQYQENINDVYTVFEEAEVSLLAISDSLNEVKNGLLKGLSSNYNNDDRVIISKTVDSMKENIISQLNKNFAGKYLFGGFNTNSPPYTTVDGVICYNNEPLEDITDSYSDYIEENIYVKTGEATQMNSSIPGLTITGSGEGNMILMLENISKALKDPSVSPDQLEDLTNQVDSFFVNVQTNISNIGSKSKNLETMQYQIEEMKINLTDLLSQIEDVDMEEAVINFKVAEMAYQSALSVGAKIIQPTLVDFLK